MFSPRWRRIHWVSRCPLGVQLYNPSFDKDKFENTVLTINGRVGAPERGLCGSLPGAQRRPGQDYTSYSRGVLFTRTIQCANPTAYSGASESRSGTLFHAERDLA